MSESQAQPEQTTDTRPARLASPWQQAGRLAFFALYAVTLLTAGGWATANVREIPASDRAMVLRMGALDRVQDAGLLLAWPQPFEQVVLLPAADRVIERQIAPLLRSTSALDAERLASYAQPMSDALAGSGYLLTGDAGVVQLDVRAYFKVSDPYAYVLQGEHVLPALDRLVTRSTVLLSAARDLDTILVARPELVGRDSQAAERRERLRADLVRGINAQLAALEHAGLGIGIRVERVDVQSSLPSPAVAAFNAVLTARQEADQAVANARTDAAKLAQAATQQADHVIQVAHAQASERLAKAQTQTASIARLAQASPAAIDPDLLLRLYRERIPAILQQAGSITSVDGADSGRLILQGVER